MAISRFNPVGAFGGSDGGAVFIRGRGQSRPGADIQTYVDGAPVYMGVFNHPLMDILPVGAVGAIRIAKGPQPQRFGDAMAAVELETKTAPADGLSTNLTLGLGDFETRRVQADHAGRAGAFDWLVAGSHIASDGHRPDAAGEMNAALAKVGWRFADGWTAGLTLLRSDNSATDPGPLGQPALKNGRYDTDLTLAVGRLAYAGERIEAALTAWSTDGRGYWFRQAGTAGDTLTDWSGGGARLQGALRLWTGGEIALGLEAEEIEGTSLFRPTNRPATRFNSPAFTIASAVAGVSQQLEVAGWTVTPSAGARLYSHSDFPEESAPFAGVVAAKGPWQARAQWARGVNYPGIDVVVFATAVIPGLGQSWRGLRAETLDHAELGFRYAGARLEVDAAWFRDDGQDRYIFIPPPPPPPRYVNRGGVDVEGFEASVTVRPLSGLSLYAGGTWLDAAPADLPYTPEWSVTFGANAAFGPWRASFDAQGLADQTVLSQGRASNAVNTVRNPGFWVANARIARLIGDRFEAFLALDNLFDETYGYRPGYPMPGASAQAGLTARF